MVDFVNNVRCFVNYTIFCELCDRMRSEVDCAKSHHRVISEGLYYRRRDCRCMNSVFSGTQSTALNIEVSVL